jgi:hypothetical protein
MSRGMTPAILALLQERARVKMYCTLNQRKPQTVAAVRQARSEAALLS